MSDQPSPILDGTLEPDLSGKKLGDYQLMRRLGRGGMADVYLAEQNSLGRQVAIKVLKKRLASDEAYVRRFHNEARAAASLVHANIVQIHEVGRVEGIHFIAQEYVAGQNLKQWLARHGAADTKTAVHIMRQVIAALHRASQQGIIHRDIKPENIMLAATGEVKVADFGLARAVSDGRAVDLTQVGVTLGTPLYMSPEQVEGHPVDPRSDLYSFGVTCYEMLAGRPPFEGESALSVAVKHLKTTPDRLENLRPDLPDGLCRMVHQLLAKRPADRYQTAAELMRELRALHVEGVDDWSGLAEEWDAPELLAMVESRSAATQRLELVMRSQALAARRRQQRLRGALAAIAGLALCVLAGVIGACVRQPADLLTVTQPAIEDKGSAMLQYFYAYELNTDEAWKSVARLYPPQSSPVNQVYAWRATQRLAELYRTQNEPDRAMLLYAELIRSDEPQFQAFGYAGQANLLAQAGKKDEAERKLAAIVPLLAGPLAARRQNLGLLDLLDESLHDQFRELARESSQ
ncbi:MAG: serine/threonine protein kinase [Planctomycetes bacterium]|nr:serine/threonine protein kinase [Planctomycetota bacterium]